MFQQTQASSLLLATAVDVSPAAALPLTCGSASLCATSPPRGFHFLELLCMRKTQAVLPHVHSTSYVALAQQDAGGFHLLCATQAQICASLRAIVVCVRQLHMMEFEWIAAIGSSIF
jgi:hypothetical protein